MRLDWTPWVSLFLDSVIASCRHTGQLVIEIDAIQTFVRPTAGAIVFAASANVVTDVSPVFAAVMGILVAGSVHAVKSAAVRPAVTATTGGAGNVPISILEDVSSTIFSIIAIVIPALVVAVIIVIAAFVVWWIWRRINKERAARV